MRKGLIVVIALLAIPGLAFGQTQLDVVGPAEYDYTVGGPLTIDVVVSNLPAGGLNGLQYSITADGGASDANWMLDPATPYANGTVFLASDYLSFIGFAGAGMPLNVVNMSAPELYFKSFGTALAGGTVASYTLLPTIDLSPLAGQTVTFSATVDPGFGNGPSPGGPGAWSAESQDLAVKIVPEPATALLLIAALPFLRRRR